MRSLRQLYQEMMFGAVVLGLLAGVFVNPQEAQAANEDYSDSYSVGKFAVAVAAFAPSLRIQTELVTTGWPLESFIVNEPSPISANKNPIPAGSMRESPIDGMKTMYVPAGTFLMGSANGYEDERAVHEVRLDAFWIDQNLVTNSQYIDCVVAGGCTSPLEDVPHHFGRPGYGNYPVVNVSWDQAQAYCAWAGRRLPTEAEWERAARGDDGRLYPWGNEAPTCKQGNFKECDNGLMPVGSFQSGASPYGALDMAGNVWEWVSDWYSPTYYLNSPVDNPQGAAGGEAHVLRGGAWNYGAGRFARATNRLHGSTIHRAPNNGFRCAVSANT